MAVCPGKLLRVLGLLLLQAVVPGLGLSIGASIGVFPKTDVANTSETTFSVGGRYLCDSGRYQSPIDIDVEACKTKEFPRLQFVDNSLFENDVQFENTGDTVKITLDDPSIRPRVKGGPLPSGSTYVVDNVHFHWGVKSSEGCEHTVSGEHFPLEAHMVMYMDMFDSFEEALNEQGVAVVGFLFKTSKLPNKLSKLTPYISKVTKPDASIIAPGASLAVLKDQIRGGFYTYVGSLTTHNCNEGVLWTIMKNLIPIGKSQIQTFRNVRDNQNHYIANWRNLKPLNHRELWMSSF